MKPDSRAITLALALAGSALVGCGDDTEGATSDAGTTAGATADQSPTAGQSSTGSEMFTRSCPTDQLQLSMAFTLTELVPTAPQSSTLIEPLLDHPLELTVCVDDFEDGNPDPAALAIIDTTPSVSLDDQDGVLPGELVSELEAASSFELLINQLDDVSLSVSVTLTGDRGAGDSPFTRVTASCVSTDSLDPLVTIACEGQHGLTRYSGAGEVTDAGAGAGALWIAPSA